MALPDNVGTGTVKGTFGVIDGTTYTPCTGTVVFTATQVGLKDAAVGITLFPRPVTVTLDETGSFTVTLIASGDPDLTPAWQWTASFKLSGVTYGPFTFSLPEDGTVDLTVAAPTPA